MSVATNNPFSVLDDDASSRPSTPPPAAPSAPQKSATAPPAKQNQRGKGPAARGGRYYSRGGATKGADAPTTAEEPAVGAEDTKRRFDGERKDGRGRGPRGTRGAGRGRTFDRHSATGKTDSGKKVHQSWGGDDGNTELKVEEAAGNDAVQESNANANDWGVSGDAATGGGDGWDAPPADEATPTQPISDEKPEGRRRDKEEEEDNTLTLEQYLAQQKEKEASIVPKLEGRKANEGADDVWSGATRLEKGDGESYFTGKTKNTTKARTEKKEKIFLESGAHFDRPSRGTRGRGSDRGERGERGRGRGARGRARGGTNGDSLPTVTIYDETAFPSLS